MNRMSKAMSSWIPACLASIAADVKRTITFHWTSFFAGALVFCLLQPPLFALWLNYAVSNGFITIAELNRSSAGFELFILFTFVMEIVFVGLLCLPHSSS
jgi:hypothetical protein